MKAYRHIIKEQLLSLTYLHISRRGKKPEKQIMISTIDGRQYHGGLCDRFKGMISLYAYCKQRNLEFRILYTYPFPLTDYLLPADYDWCLKEGEYSDCLRDSRVMYLRGENASRLLRLKTRKQLQFYGNMDLLDELNISGGTSYRWGKLFKELFRPVPILENQIAKMKKDIGSPEYNAAVFRFQNLLGDFSEYRFKPLEKESDREKLISRCLAGLRDYIAQCGNHSPILVTSDSITFLKRAAEFDRVFIIPGTLVHIDGSKEKPDESQDLPYIKSFLDFFMLAGAREIVCIGTRQMYPSQFPMYAAKINEIPFERIVLE